MPRFVLAAVAAVGLSACSDDPDKVAPDAGTEVDAGTDAGTEVDAGTDAGIEVDAGTDASTGSSHGRGKLTCRRVEQVDTVLGTLPLCVSQVGDTEVKYIQPYLGIYDQPTRLAIYLHEDGAAEYLAGNPSPLAAQLTWAYLNNTLFVAALAPNTCSWRTAPKYTDCATEAPTEARDLEGKNAQALLNLIQMLRLSFDILNEPILFGGAAGGASWLTASYLPRYGDRYPGIYALACGGEKPWSGTMDWDTSQPALRGATRLSFTSGDKDSRRSEILAAEAYFAGLQLPVDSKVIPDATGCEFAPRERIIEVWSEATSQ